MSFKIFRPRQSRIYEVNEMFQQLDRQPDHVAVIDMSPPNVLQYARKLGYEIATHKMGKHKTKIWLIKPPTSTQSDKEDKDE